MKQLVLIGGGHSHVEVIRRFALQPAQGLQLTLVNPTRHTPYSGMLPGLIAGHYDFAQCHIDLLTLAQAANCRFIETAVNGLHADARLVFCTNGETLGYDVTSIDIGSTPGTLGVVGATRNTLKVKPTDEFLRRWNSVLEQAQQRILPEGYRIVVAGGGAAGVEVLLSMQYRLENAGYRHGRYAIITDGAEVLTGHPPGTQRTFRDILRQRNVDIYRKQRVVEVGRNSVTTDSGQHIAADLVVWATGASPAGWPRACGLAADARGFLRVNSALQVIGRDRIFAAGDIASIEGASYPKSGVYAVRQGPPLAENLRRALAGEPLLGYQPQKRALALISTGDRYAVASRGWLSARGAWVWRWKDHIDRGFMKKYQAL